MGEKSADKSFILIHLPGASSSLCGDFIETVPDELMKYACGIIFPPSLVKTGPVIQFSKRIRLATYESGAEPVHDDVAYKTKAILDNHSHVFGVGGLYVDELSLHVCLFTLGLLSWFFPLTGYSIVCRGSFVRWRCPPKMNRKHKGNNLIPSFDLSYCSRLLSTCLQNKRQFSS